MSGLTIDEGKLKKERTESSKENRKKVNKRFCELFPLYIAKVAAFGIHSDEIKSPLNYTKLSNDGGAAEGVRAMLAYYIVVYNLINEFSNAALSPLVLDTPRQHEQADQHYERIVKIILEDTPTESQVILCGLDSEKLAPLKRGDNVTMLEHERALLNVDEYETVHQNIASVFETQY